MLFDFTIGNRILTWNTRFDDSKTEKAIVKTHVRFCVRHVKNIFELHVFRKTNM